MSLVADINVVNLYYISYCRPTRDPRMPVSQLNGSSNMSWKKKVCLRHLRKKIVCFCSGRKKKFCFLDGRKKIIWLGRKTIPPLPVLNGPPLRYHDTFSLFPQLRIVSCYHTSIIDFGQGLINLVLCLLKYTISDTVQTRGRARFFHFFR